MFVLAGSRPQGACLRACFPLALALVLLVSAFGFAQAQEGSFGQIDIVGPAGSDSFGANVTPLPNGNFLVVDPQFDAGDTQNVGAVFLYDGGTLALISTLTGSSADDQVGSGGVRVLPNGHAVLFSPEWNGQRGAVTWLNAASGRAGAVSASNSLVGGEAGDRVGMNDETPGLIVLSNGHYVIYSPSWRISDGAVTWNSATGGRVGLVSAANSLVGDSESGTLGDGGITPLTNGHYVVASMAWNGARGAVTWANGATGTTVGAVTADNSLVGSVAGDWVGWGGVRALSNGNYVAVSFEWNDDRGAVTWGNGTGGTVGVVSAGNSLVGSAFEDNVGLSGLVALSNGNYVVQSATWNEKRGAVTWGNGTGGTVGAISADNSLVGSLAGDEVGRHVHALSNGNYVTWSHLWNEGTGAVTWANGATGIKGQVSAANSLIGKGPGDEVGYGELVALSNGHYVVLSPHWDDGQFGNNLYGAVTWANGTTATIGTVSAANSLVGSEMADEISLGGVVPLTNGNYVVCSYNWGSDDQGAATWGSGSGGTVGPVTATNSLVGGYGDNACLDSVTALPNGHYVVGTVRWGSGSAAVTWSNGSTGAPFGLIDAGNSMILPSAEIIRLTLVGGSNYVVTQDRALDGRGLVRWASGNGGGVGPSSAANSLVGANADFFIDDGDKVGSGGVVALANGDYVVASPAWGTERGAVTWARGDGSSVGEVSAANSLVGTRETFNSDPGDRVGNGSVIALANGSWAAQSTQWSRAANLRFSGAVSLAKGGAPPAGTVGSANSVLGGVPSGGSRQTLAFEPVHQLLLVGRPSEDILTVAFLGNTLTVAKAGSGTGTVSSTPPGIACGATCSAPFPPGFSVTLVATPAAGSTFAGWSGACTQTSGPCTVTMSQARSVTASFATTPGGGTGQAEVTIAPSGPGGQIKVEVVPPGMTTSSVEVSPLATYPIGTLLRVTAQPGTGFVFSGWGGSLSGSENPKIVTVNGPLTIAATFLPESGGGGLRKVFLPLAEK